MSINYSNLGVLAAQVIRLKRDVKREMAVPEEERDIEMIEYWKNEINRLEEKMEALV